MLFLRLYLLGSIHQVILSCYQIVLREDPAYVDLLVGYLSGNLIVIFFYRDIEFGKIFIRYKCFTLVIPCNSNSPELGVMDDTESLEYLFRFVVIIEFMEFYL